MGWLLELDAAVVVWIYNNFRIDILDGPMVFITKLGDGGAIWIAVALVLLIACCWKKELRKVALVVTLSLILSALLCNIIIKPMVGRVRPYDLLGLDIIVERLNDYSFPSGHTSAAFACGAGVWLCNRRYGKIVIALALLMAFTRLYLCVHFPTDVLGGMVLGGLCAVIAYKAVEKIFNKKIRY